MHMHMPYAICCTHAVPCPHRAVHQMFLRLAMYTALYVVLELAVHLSFTGRSDESFALFVLLHQLMELFIAVAIGFTFRAQPFNVLFQQVQQVASDMADQLLPSITTVEIKPDLLNGADLIAWRADLRLGAEGDTHMPTTLVVLNPGDKEMPPPSTVPSRRIPASVYASPPPGPPPTAPPQAPPSGSHRRLAGNRVLASLRHPPRFAARFTTRPTQCAASAASPSATPSATTSTSTVPPAVEMSESTESPGRAGWSDEEASALADSPLQDLSRESSGLQEEDVSSAGAPITPQQEAESLEADARPSPQ